MRIEKSIPNLLTLINVLLGCLAIVYLYYDHIELHFTPKTALDGAYFDGQFNLEKLRFGKLTVAVVLVLIASVIDLFDGALARLFNAQSEVGKMLDTLADFLNFGVVPGLMIFQLLSFSWFDSLAAFENKILLFIPALFIPIALAWRLAKFTAAEERNNSWFNGLPSPAVGLFFVSLPMVWRMSESPLVEWITNPWFLYITILLVGGLAISNISLLSLKFGKDGLNKWRFVLVGLAVLLLAVCYIGFGIVFTAIPLVILAYVILSIIAKLSQKQDLA